MTPVIPHPTNGHGYVEVQLRGNAQNQDAGMLILEGMKDVVVPGRATVRLVSRMQGGAPHAGAPGDRAILLVEATVGHATAHGHVQALQTTIAGDAAHFGLGQHWCCYSDH